VQDEFVSVGPATLRVRRVGAGPPLLIINGIGASLEMLEPLVGCLDGRELIMFDLPGCGRSALSRVPLRMRQLGGLVGRLVEELGYERVDVLGYSFGGAVALELTRQAPELVRRLVLCGATPGAPAVPPSPMVTAMMLTPARYYSATLGAAILPRVVGGRTARDPDVLREGLRQRQQHPPSVLGYTYQLYAITGWSSHHWLHRIRTPTLLMHGDDDPLAPLVNARWMAHRMPNARLRVLRGAGHMFLADAPATPARHIRTFLADDQP
jgi:poly(3-hydroxyalkanoate) depolymerase